MTVFDVSLKDRVAIVTGANGGVGRATALAFADAGANVVCTDINVSEAEKTSAEIRAKGRKSLAIKADATKKAEVDNVIAETVKEFGTIDILVNNAGRDMHLPLMRLREDGWDKTFNINVKGYFLFAQAAAKVMIEHKKGNIIQIGSGNAKMANPYNGAYGPSKAAVEQLSRTFASELAHHNIRVNYVAPGFIRTKMLENVWSNPETLRQFEDAVPLKRIAEPDDIAAVILFLASDMSRYMTGASIYVDGGVQLSGFSLDIISRTMPPEYRI